jgi:hypothetical protein
MEKLFGAGLKKLYVPGDLKRQGAGRAAIAHFMAGLLILLFSAGSLVALGADDLNSVLAEWQASYTLNIPSAISLAVSFFMVLAMDTGLLYGASVLRVMAARRAPASEPMGAHHGHGGHERVGSWHVLPDGLDV